LKDFSALLKQQFIVEFRDRSVISGILLYLLSTVLIVYFTFNLKQNLINPAVWTALFWIISLFTAINAVGKSFLAESKGLSIYYYSLVSAQVLILSRIVYNAILCSLLFSVTFLLFSIMVFNPVQHIWVFLLTILLTSIGFSASLTLVSGLAAKAGNSHVLMAVLSFPVIISILLIAIRITRNCVDGLALSLNYPDLISLAAINMISITVSYLLFPYIWRS
jgi:heme exporter protein B